MRVRDRPPGAISEPELQQRETPMRDQLIRYPR